MLRKIRVGLALLFIVGITLLFLDFTGTVHAWLGWMAKIQFLPAVLALNVAVVLALVAFTLLLLGDMPVGSFPGYNFTLART